VDFARLRDLFAALEREGVEYAVFGAVALNLHGFARFTEDLDLFIAADASNIEGLKRALRSTYNDSAIDELSASDLLGEYPAIQYGPPDGAFHLDIVTRLGTAFSFQDLEVDRVPFGDLFVKVVSPRTLYRMKKDTVQLKDRADAELLKQRFSLEDF
jgi:hypothetical protein